MIKLIFGVKGTGKTKKLIELANSAVDKTDGAVVCVEKGTKLIHEIKYQARLVDTDEYLITDAHALYGFISGIYASNSDVTDIFVDSALKICGNSLEDFCEMVKELDIFTQTHNVNIVMTSSIPLEEVPEQLTKYC